MRKIDESVCVSNGLLSIPFSFHYTLSNGDQENEKRGLKHETTKESTCMFERIVSLMTFCFSFRFYTTFTLLSLTLLLLLYILLWQ